MTERMTVAVADLIPGDIIPVRGYTVEGYPHLSHHMGQGTYVEVTTAKGLPLGLFYADSERTVDIIR